MILALNLGNTHIGYGFIEAGEITSTGRASTPPADRAFEIEMLIDEAIGRSASRDETVELVVASVVPAATDALREIAARRGFRLLEANDTTVPVRRKADTPDAADTLDAADTPVNAGHDRLVNALAAARLYGVPAIVVDLGTATTFDVVDARGAFVGGAIAPGVGLGIDALSTRTAQLPRVVVALPERAIGRNTVEAIQSGAVLGHIGMVEYLIDSIADELGAAADKPKVVLTGGLSAHSWASRIAGVTAIDPLLTLRGLAILHSETPRLSPVGQT